MAVLPREQITQRSGVALVGITASTKDNAPAETYWQSTTDYAAFDISLTKAVAANQADYDTTVARLDALVPANQNNLLTQGVTRTYDPPALVVEGSGNVSLPAAPTVAKTLTALDSFFDGGNFPIAFSKAATPAQTKGTATVSGTTLTYTANAATTGPETIGVTATDATGATATLTVNVTIG